MRWMSVRNRIVYGLPLRVWWLKKGQIRRIEYVYREFLRVEFSKGGGMEGGACSSTRNFRRAVNLLIGTALTLAICSLSALSQSGAGSIQGTVTDHTGAV